MAIPSIAKALQCLIPSKPNTTAVVNPPPDNQPNSNGGTEETPIPKAATTKEEAFRQVFRHLDANDDGKISAEELSDYFASIGNSVSHEDSERIIREFSKDSSAFLEFEEFVRMMEARDKDEDHDKVLRQAFEVYEVEKGSGVIKPEGLRVVLRRLGQVKSYEECEGMIRAFDLDGNGVLDFHEFARMMA